MRVAFKNPNPQISPSFSQSQLSPRLPPLLQPPPSPKAQLAANRDNAEKSTGPKTEAGKLIASHNAVKTGLTGRTELGAGYSGDPVALEILISRAYEKDFRNLSLQERRLRNYLKADAAELSRIPAASNR